MDNLNGILTRAVEVADSLAARANGDANMETQQGFQFQNNSTSTELNDLKFAVARSIRIAIISLSGLNALVAGILIFGVFWSCAREARRNDPSFRIRNSFISLIRPCDILPLALCTGIILQSVGFAIAQSKGLDSLLILGCVPVSQIMLPAILITPFIQLTFGIETTVRALWPATPFPKRQPWAVFVCLATPVVGAVVAYVVTRFFLPPSFCYASLFWFVQRWSLGCFVIFTFICAFLFFGTIITVFKLYRNPSIEAVTRMIASRTVYYMGLAVVENLFKVPFFFSLVFVPSGDRTEARIQLAMAAAIVANVSALLTGGLYIFLRTSKRVSIGLQGYFEYEKNYSDKQNECAAHDVFYNRQIQLPVSPVRSGYPSRAIRKGGLSPTPNSDTLTFGAIQTTPEGPAIPEIARRKTHVRKESYNLFPSKQSMPSLKTNAQLPSLVYCPPSEFRGLPKDSDTNSLVPPPLTVNSWGHDESDTDTLITQSLPVHSSMLDEADTDMLLPPFAITGDLPMKKYRGSSLGSSATVQIGLRLSNFERMTRGTSTLHDHDSTYNPCYPAPTAPRAVSGLTIATMNSVRSVSHYGDPPPSIFTIDKQLPPVPLGAVPKDTKANQEEEGEIRLSPTVYSPPSNSISKSTSPVRETAAAPRMDEQRRTSVRHFNTESVGWI